MLKLLVAAIFYIFISYSYAQEGPGGVDGDATNRYWYDASTLSVVDGSSVSTWQNLGGNGTAAVQNTGSRQPTFQSDPASLINGHPVIRFDGNNDFFSIPNSNDINLAATHNRTYWFVFRTGADVTSRQVLYEEGGTVRGLNAYIFNGNVYVGAWNFNNDGAGAPWGFSHVNTGILANTTYVFGFVMQGNNGLTGTIDAYLDGQNFGTINNVGQLYAHSGAIGLGAKNSATVFENGSSGGTGNYFNGDLAEFIQYTITINDAEVDLINNYLSAKYNVPLLSGNQYSMDNVGNGNYDFDVAGIGQANDGSNSTDGQGQSILRVNSAGNLSNNEYLIFGHDNGDLIETAAGTPATIDYRLERVWRIDEQGEVGNHNVLMDISGLVLSGSGIGDYFLLVDPVDTDFSDATIHNPTSLNSGILTFSGIDLDANDHVCLGINSSLIGNTGPGGVLNDDRYRFWFRADQLNLNDGNVVSTWNNDGGNTNNAIQNSNSARPTFQNDAASLLNDHPVIRFDGSNDFLEIPDNTDLNLAAASARTFFMTFRTGNNVNSRQVLFEEGGTIRGLNIYIFNGRIYVGGWNVNNDGAGAPWNFASVNTGIAANTAYNLSVVYQGNNNVTGTIEVYLDGNNVGTINNVGRLYAHSGDIGIGAKNQDTFYETGTSGGNGQYFGGDIAEFIIYNFSLNSTMRLIVENYLSAKYDIAQGTNDNYTMDNSGNGDYDHDMAGIGRESGTSLHHDAKGPGIVRINVPNSLDNGDYLLWGHDGEDLCNSLDVPGSLNARLLRTWRCSEIGDVGTVNISFDLSDIDYGAASNVRLLTDSDGIFNNATVISPSSNSSDVFVFSGINLSNAQYFTLGTAELFVGISGDSTRWTGGSTDWFASANWTHGVPDSNINVRIPSGVGTYPVINGNTKCKNIIIESGASLEISGTNELHVFGSWSNSGSFTENTSTLHFKGDCGRAAFNNPGTQEFFNVILNNPNGAQISNGTVEIIGSLDLRNGTFMTNDSLTLISNSGGTARIVEITGGAITGDIEMQRFIDAGSTNWRFLSFSVSGANLEQFDDDFITSGIPGSDYPNWPSASNPWPSLYSYDETVGTSFNQGFIAVSNMNNVLGVGEGLWIWCGDTITGTQPFTVDVRGPANTGSINLPVTFTASSGSMDDDGWNMVANPYPCTIDWDSPDWTKTNIEDAVYIWNPDLQQYATYVAGAATNGGSNLIASSQAFMVHADAASPTLTIEESCKVNQDHGFLKASSISTDLLRIQVSDGNYQDETVLRFDQVANNQFDTYADARKNQSGITNVPKLYTSLNGVDYAINTLNEDTLIQSIALNYRPISTGAHSLKITDTAAISDFSCVLLEDTFNDTWTNILLDSVYHFTANIGDPISRFVLHFSRGAEANFIDPLCSNDSTGSILLESILPNSEVSVSYAGNQIFLDTVGSTVTLPNLPAGTYEVEVIQLSGNCPSDSMDVVLVDPSPLQSSASSLHETCPTCCDGSIGVMPLGGTAPYSIMWDDPALSGLTPSGLCSGTYTYDLVDANGCSIQGSVQISSFTSIPELSESVSVYPNPSDGLFFVESTSMVEVKISDSRGRIIQILPQVQGKQLIDLENVETGLYHLVISAGDKTEILPLIIE